MKTESQVEHEAKDKFMLRFHAENQRAEIKRRALNSKRSMNSEILFLVERGIEAIDGAKNGGSDAKH